MAVFKCSACGGAHLKIESPPFYWSGEGVFARVCSLTEIEHPLELAGTLRAPLIHGVLVTCLSELTFFRHVRDDVVGRGHSFDLVLGELPAHLAAKVEGIACRVVEEEIAMPMCIVQSPFDSYKSMMRRLT